MSKKILILIMLLSVLSVSVSGCGEKDEEMKASAEQAEDFTDEVTETSEKSSDEEKSEEISEVTESETPEKKHTIKKNMIPEEVFDILYGSWISDDDKDELIFSAGVGDLSYKAELKSTEPYAFSLLVSYFDAAHNEDGTKIRFITGNGGVGSCRELILSEDENSVLYKTGREKINDEFIDNYITFHRKSDTVLPDTDSKWKGKKGAFLGDSITQGINTSEGKIYWNYLSDILKLSEAEPYGLAGSCISSASEMGTGILPFVTRYKDIKKDADFIVVFGGTNDYGFNTPLGNENDTEDTSFYGSLYVLLTGLKNEHPDASVVYMTPLHRSGFGGLKYDRQKNKAGYTLYDYIDAIKTQCQKLEIPVIDTNTVYGLNPSDQYDKTKYLNDGLHPNEEGHKILAERIASCFEGI